MPQDSLKEIEAQTALALAAIGVAFAQTLAEGDGSTGKLGLLRTKAGIQYEHLREIGAVQAAAMFGPFVRALHDRKLMPESQD